MGGGIAKAGASGASSAETAVGAKAGASGASSAETAVGAKLKVKVVGAKGLQDAKSDPFCVCRVPRNPDVKLQTKAVTNKLNPEWNEEFIVEDFLDGDKLEFAIFDREALDQGSNLGSATLGGQLILSKGFHGALPLSEAGGGGLPTYARAVNVIIEVIRAAPQQPAPAASMDESAPAGEAPTLVEQSAIVKEAASPPDESAPSEDHAAPAEEVDVSLAETKPVVGVVTSMEAAAVDESCGPMEASSAETAVGAELKVKLVGATGLRNADWNGKSDPFCVCRLPRNPDVKLMTKVVHNNLNPEWNEEFIVEDFVGGDTLEFAIFDHDAFNQNDNLGWATLNGGEILPNGFHGALPLSGAGGGGAVNVIIEVISAAPQQPAPAASIIDEKATTSAEERTLSEEVAAVAPVEASPKEVATEADALPAPTAESLAFQGESVPMDESAPAEEAPTLVEQSAIVEEAANPPDESAPSEDHAAPAGEVDVSLAETKPVVGVVASMEAAAVDESCGPMEASSASDPDCQRKDPQMQMQQREDPQMQHMEPATWPEVAPASGTSRDLPKPSEARSPREEPGSDPRWQGENPQMQRQQREDPQMQREDPATSSQALPALVTSRDLLTPSDARSPREEQRSCPLWPPEDKQAEAAALRIQSVRRSQLARRELHGSGLQAWAASRRNVIVMDEADDTGAAEVAAPETEAPAQQPAAVAPDDAAAQEAVAPKLELPMAPREHPAVPPAETPAPDEPEALRSSSSPRPTELSPHTSEAGGQAAPEHPEEQQQPEEQHARASGGDGAACRRPQKPPRARSFSSVWGTTSSDGLRSSPSLVSTNAERPHQFLRSLSGHQSTPMISFAPSRESCICGDMTRKGTRSPGAGSYTPGPPEKQSKYPQKPAYSQPSAPRFDFPKPNRKEPGPGQYEPKEFRYPKDPKVGFPQAKRGRPNRVAQSVPGPGAYETRGHVADGPMFTANGRPPGQYLLSKALPGPGTYEPGALLTKPTIPKVGFGTAASREDLHQKHATPNPGPAAYDLQSDRPMGTRTCKFSIKPRRTQHEFGTYVTPGAGAYDTHHTSFGYGDVWKRKATRRVGASRGHDLSV